MEELIEALIAAKNVRTLFYDKESDTWEISFYNGKPNKVETEYLLDFLQNA